MSNELFVKTKSGLQAASFAQVKELSVAVWTTLRTCPELSKKDLLDEMPVLRGMLNYCPLCDVFLEDTYFGAPNCGRCPLGKKFDLYKESYHCAEGYYAAWHAAATAEERVEAANQILLMIMAWDPSSGFKGAFA